MYIYMYMYMGSSPTRGSSFFLGKATALGVLCCFALFVCLTLLASFFHLSFKQVYTCTYMRDEEGSKKQAKSNKQQSKATQHAQGSHFSNVHIHVHVHVPSILLDTVSPFVIAV